MAKRKAAASQARLKKSAAKSYTKAPSYGYKRTVGQAPTGKSKVVTGGAKFPTGGVSLTGKTPLITQGPLTGAGVAQPGSRQKAAAVKMKAAMMVGQTQRVRKKKSPAQAALVRSAMPKAKAQRTAAEIAAMHAYRAGKRKKAKKTTRKLYGPRDFY